MLESSLFKRLELQLLMNLTASAFDRKPERIWTYPHRKALEAYALFTSSYLREGAEEELLQRMNQKAYRMGSLLRTLFLVRSESRARRIIITLYRNIGIRLSFEDGRNLRFHRCYFSKHYTPAVCKAASMLDDGIIRGITGQPAGCLCFSHRITEGCSYCRAILKETPKE